MTAFKDISCSYEELPDKRICGKEQWQMPLEEKEVILKCQE
jgi:hypothetical protein